MKLLKNYKKMYETELNNRKFYEEQYRKLKKENVIMQKKFLSSQRELKYEIVKLKLALQDSNGFLRQEKQVSNALRNERNKWRETEVTKDGE